jgi:hypothetical protein
LIFLRARYYEPRQGRFLSRDAFAGSVDYPATLNPYLYALNNPLLHTDPSGMYIECDPFQRADLTQWLVDEMNKNRKSYIFIAIWTGLHFPEFMDLMFPSLEHKLPTVLASYALAYGLFYDVVKTNGLWDFKWKISDLIGVNIRISEAWYRNDLPGNVHFGFIGLAAGFNRQILHCGADYATNGIPCSGSDPIEDYEAIEAGYAIYELSRWGPVDEEMLKIALEKRPLLALGIATGPNELSSNLPWPYPVGSFDDGSSGWVIKQR